MTAPAARAQRASQSISSRACWAAVLSTLMMVPWVAAPRQVRFPPHTFRLTTAGRMACSARQLVAWRPGSSGTTPKVTAPVWTGAGKVSICVATASATEVRHADSARTRRNEPVRSLAVADRRSGVRFPRFAGTAGCQWPWTRGRVVPSPGFGHKIISGLRLMLVWRYVPARGPTDLEGRGNGLQTATVTGWAGQCPGWLKSVCCPSG